MSSRHSSHGGRSVAPLRRLLALLAALASLLASTLTLGLLVAPTATADGLSPTGYDLRGVVRGADGAPVPGVGVDLYEYATDSTGGDFVRGTVTDASGAFSVPATGGRYTVFYSDREGQRVIERREPVVLDRFTPVQHVTLADPERPRTVTGRVLDDSGAALGGTLVTLFHLFDHGPGHWRYVVAAGSATTRPDGSYVLQTSYGGGHLGVGATRPDGTVVGTAGGPVADDPGLVAEAPQVSAGTLRISAPVVTPRVDVAGRPAVGALLSATPVDLAPQATEVAVTWLRDGDTIAAGRRYTPTADDLGHAVSALVEATVGTERVQAESSPVLVGRATSLTRAAPVRATVPAGRRSAVAVRVRSAAGDAGRVVVREGATVLGTAPHVGDAVTRVRVRGLRAGRHVLTVRYTGDALTHGSAARTVLRVARR